jgi:heme-binding protein
MFLVDRSFPSTQQKFRRLAMLFSARNGRRTLCAAALTAVILGAGAPAAVADPPPPPPPGCSAADFDQLRSQVDSATADYLFAHPDVNAFFSSLRGLPHDQMRGQVKTYLANNPQTQSDLDGIRGPLRDMKTRCQ